MLRISMIAFACLSLIACDVTPDKPALPEPVISADDYCDGSYSEEAACVADVKCKWEAKEGKDASCKAK